MGVFFVLYGFGGIENERRSREFESVRGERRDRPLAGCHDRADAADAEGVDLAIPFRQSRYTGTKVLILFNSSAISILRLRMSISSCKEMK